jgi:phosphoserine phosphatase
MHGYEKAQAVVDLANQHGLDLNKCFAYSDSKNDIPLLSKVGHPTVVNPDSELRAYAKLQKWPIHDYRRERLVKRYAIPAGATAVALIGAGAGLAISSKRKNKSAQ